jgi:1,4-alpha-glucan branching enzyme
MLKKQQIKSRQSCKVTFEILQSELPEALDVESVHLAGEFNDWDTTATALTYSKKAKAYRTTLELEPGRAYRFRYLVNGEHWCNDWAADDYVANGLGEDDCVVVTPTMESV